ncbi:CBASS cGAMP-activated phospholipase [Cellulomonas cellasea]|uniref:PNPLA domain-containing protein n=1 Tax=Cellulomonas cellasea TaxID=43670 RepID=A0A4Y3L242_9CELL|nr:CBASS cGAMP-activated phospholipase [Cellulomonas cellasea]GEA89726.1 hypothetical protein similar to Patatin [Cellulomonas cellasea]
MFHVLALDGGGAKALFTAHVLARVEEDLSVDIASNFDLICGTSAGGIVALCLGKGVGPSTVVEDFSRLVGTVFPARRRSVRLGLGAVRPMYSGASLRSALADVLGSTTMSESRVRLAIAAWDTLSSRPQVYKTPHHADIRRDGRLSMVDVALATSSAPAYFPAAAVDSQHMIDGGVWANNPSLIGVAEAVGVLGVPLDEVKVLNIGTTEASYDHSRSLSSGGWVQWSTRATGLILRAGSKGGQGVARYLLGSERYHRFDARVPAGRFKLDHVGSSEINAIASFASRHVVPTYEREFADHVAPSWT